jgi:hypothetical protein
MGLAQVYPKLTSDDAVAKIAPGTVWMDDDGNSYKYILVEDANLAVNNTVEFSDTTGWEVTKDRAGGASLGRAFAGVALGTVTDAQYGVVQVGGVATVTVPASTAITAGDALVNHPTADGGVAAATTATRAFAWGMALASETTSAATSVKAIIF